PHAVHAVGAADDGNGGAGTVVPQRPAAMIVELEPEPPCPRHTAWWRAVEGGGGRSDEAAGYPSSQEHKRASVHSHNVDGLGGFVHAARWSARGHRRARVNCRP